MERIAVVVACLCTIFVTLLIQNSSAQTCVKRIDSNCICDFTDASTGTVTSTIDLTKLANTDYKPAFDYKTAEKPDQTDFQYAYNPCFPFTDPAGGQSCVNVAVCQRNGAGNLHYGLGTPTAVFSSDGKTITYTSAPRTTNVQLNCDQNANSPAYRVVGQEDPNIDTYKLEITSCHCCPGGCTKSSSKSGLSFGSVLCILFVVLLFVYIVGGVLFQRYARGASGKEVIPNVSFWQEFPLLVKDGFVFVASGCGFRQQDAAYESI